MQQMEHQFKVATMRYCPLDAAEAFHETLWLQLEFGIRSKSEKNQQNQ